MRLKIIFLDIDGVMNSQEVADEWYQKTGRSGFGGFFKEEDKIGKEKVLWGEDLVKNLKDIVDATGAQIVICSTWRVHFSVDKFKEMFRLYGWEAPVIDKTPIAPRRSDSRGIEVNKWLTDNPEVKTYVILDDTPDFLPDQQYHYIQTDPMIGLTIEDARRAVNILNM